MSWPPPAPWAPRRVRSSSTPSSFSFGLLATVFVWGPAIPAALIVFALAQVGVHLVFVLRLIIGLDDINNAMALAFGVPVVGLVIGGSM